MVSLKDISIRCGVSIATVSKALNNHSDISEATKDRILKVAREMGYYPNSFARALKTNRTYNLGVLFVDEAQSGLTHEYFANVLDSFKVEAESHGYDITFINKHMGLKKMSYYEHSKYRGVDGVVIACINFDDPDVLELINGDLPVVTIDHVFNNRTAIISDNIKGMRDLITYIYEMGHRKIAYIGGPHESPNSMYRYAGFEQALKDFGLVLDKELIVEGNYKISGGSEGVLELLKRGRDFTAVVCANDLMAIGAMEVLKGAGFRIPEDVSITGFDDIPMAKYVEPKLTTVAQPCYKMGEVATELLIKFIEGKTVEDTVITLKPKLIIRNSVKKVI